MANKTQQAVDFAHCEEEKSSDSRKEEKILCELQCLGNSNRTEENILPATPQKNLNTMPNFTDDPLTPNANLKMLADFSVATKRDEKRELFGNEDVFQEDSCSTVSDSVGEKEKNADEFDVTMQLDYGVGGGRKFKSLGLLCQKFLQKYPDDAEGKEINLHEIARELQVERRRIYDIVNVLESLDYVTKKGKNTYVWHGSKRLIPTLCKLKALAHKIYGCENTQGVQLASGDLTDVKIPYVWLRNGIVLSEQDENDTNYVSMYKKEEEAKRRKNKSLGIFCQKLLMLFMVSKDHTVALEKAAREVIEVPDDPLGKNKTKVRRLYDIANILTSMGLIEKTVVFSGARKTAFKWVGVNLDSLQPDTETLDRTLSGIDAYAPTKHSLFSQPTALADFKLGSRSIRKLGARSMSASNIITKKSKLPRTKSAATISRKRSSVETFSSQNSPASSVFSECDSNNNQEISTDKEDKENYAVVSPARNIISPRSDAASPDELLFREEFKKLQERFPDKTDGILQLLSASQNLTDKANPETNDRGSRCNLLNRLEIDEPIAKKSRVESGNPVSLIDHGNTVNSSKFGQYGKQISHGLGRLISVKSYNNASKVSVPKKTSIGIQTDSSLLQRSDLFGLGQDGTPVSRNRTQLVAGSHVSPAHPVASSPRTHFLSCDGGESSTNNNPATSRPLLLFNLKQASLKSLLHPELQSSQTSQRAEVTTCLINANTTFSKLACGKPASSKLAPSALTSQIPTPRPLQSSVLQNTFSKGDNFLHMIKIPTSSLSLLSTKFVVSEKENMPGSGSSVASIATQQTVPLRENNAKTPLPILPKHLDLASEETPERTGLLSITGAKLTKRKLATDDS